MDKLFVNKLSEIPPSYSFPSVEESSLMISQDGRDYRFIGYAEEKYSIPGRLWFLILSLVHAILTPLGLFSSQEQDRTEFYQIVLNGKKIIEIYAPDDSDLSIKKTDDIWHDAFVDTIDGDVKIQKIRTDLKSVDVKLSDLEKEILLLKKGDATQQKKAALLQRGLDLFRQNKCSIDLETFRLTNRDDFKLGYDKSKKEYTAIPSYFAEIFNSTNSLNLSVTRFFYDYEPSGVEGVEDYWIDFANASLGGGCFTYGFVQEEIMVHEMPDLAALIAGHLSSKKEGWCEIFTREGNLADRNQVMKGVPNPYLIKEVTRVQAIDNEKAYGGKMMSLTETELIDGTVALEDPQKVNLLAIAAPKLFTKNRNEQWNHLTLEDIFNTFMAGCALINENSENPIIHSGKLGCGAFNNDIHAVYLLHCLVAQHLGVQIKLHGYEDSESKQFENSWNDVSPQLTGKSLKDCIEIISKHLLSNYS